MRERLCDSTTSQTSQTTTDYFYCNLVRRFVYTLLGWFLGMTSRISGPLIGAAGQVFIIGGTKIGRRIKPIVLSIRTHIFHDRFVTFSSIITNVVKLAIGNARRGCSQWVLPAPETSINVSACERLLASSRANQNPPRP